MDGLNKPRDGTMARLSGQRLRARACTEARGELVAARRSGGTVVGLCGALACEGRSGLMSRWVMTEGTRGVCGLSRTRVDTGQCMKERMNE